MPDSHHTIFDHFDDVAILFMQKHGVALLRVSLAVVFIWFGMLKIFGVSPVHDLVARAVPWFPPDQFVPLLGVWEVVIGTGLLVNRALRIVLILFWLQLAGTFLVLIVRPDIAFQHGNILLLTTEGEFVIKNLVLIAAGIVIGGTLHAAKKKRSNENRLSSPDRLNPR